ncbi:MAG: hypothetical protein O3C40_19560 [Planctomycetota bacterium]|nr:hypothetical protein [Planctomycetota bacterium]
MSRIAFGFLGLLLIGIVLVYAVLYFGSVNGEDFSPDSFHRRRFAYLELPLIGVQITPIRHTDTTNDLERYLAAQKLLPKPAKPDDRWDLVVANQGVRGGIQGDARILSQYLDAMNEDRDSIWLKWSEAHVEMAKVLWPAVAEVARHELYSFVPELFVLARSASTPDQLQNSIDQALADKYLLTAETFEALEQNDFAAELFTEVLRHAPDRAETVRGRDESVDAGATEQRGDEAGLPE